ncbi:MAG: polysaccharide biosynthesis tyrosine autokinase [Smithellaceae bacterium]|nr:polysaccharide biosynthesis tyrosine autokinase [Smithellaceae bacterium]
MEINDKQINLEDYLRVVIKHRWTILTVFAVVFISVLIYSFTVTPIYRASTRLLVERSNPVLFGQEVLTADVFSQDYYQTQYKIIESRALAREVINRLHLDQNEEFVPKRKGSLLGGIASSIKGVIAAVGGLFNSGETVSRPPKIIYEPDSPLVTSFSNRIAVTPIRNTRLVDVSFEAKNPFLAAKIANTIARAYIDLSLETKLKGIQETVLWLDDQVAREKGKVAATEQALLRYKEQHGIITDFSTDVESITAQKLAALNAQVIDASAKRVEAETRYRQASELLKNPDTLDSVPAAMSSEIISEIKKLEVDAYRRMSELSDRYGARHPQIISIQHEIDSLEGRKTKEVRRIIDSLNNEYQVALAREQSLRGELNRQKAEALNLNQKAIDYSVLKREADTTKEMYDLLIKRFKETSVAEDIKMANIRIVDFAEIPKSPVKPKKAQNILLAVIVGLSLGVGLAFFIEYIDNTIKIPDDIKQHLPDVPYLGPVPAISSSNADNPDVERRPEDDLITVASPKSTASESYRGIRTGILFSSADTSPQLLLVTSAGPHEGKTITAANLAVTMAQAGSRVLVIDCDMRRPRLHKVFSENRDKGMSNILVGACNLEDAVMKTTIPNIDIITSGPIPPNPSEILGSHRMTDFLSKARETYERIIIDSPPITAVTDAAVLSQYVDGVVLVIRSGETHREVIKNGIAQLRSVNAHILGAVLNGVEMGSDSYYYYQYYYYYYGEDGEKKKHIRRKKRSRSRYSDDSMRT